MTQRVASPRADAASYDDNLTTERPTFWVGSNHGASIIKLEPLD